MKDSQPEAVEAALEQLKHPRWRQRASALLALREATSCQVLQALGQRVKGPEAFEETEAPQGDTADTSLDGNSAGEAEASEAPEDDRVLADVPLPMNLPRPESGSSASVSSFGELDDEALPAEPAAPVPPEAEELLVALRRQAARGELDAEEQLRVLGMARLSLQGGACAAVQRAALEVLEELGGSPELHQLLRPAASHEDAQVRGAVARAAARIAGRCQGRVNVEAAAKICGKLSEDEDAAVRRHAVAGLAKVDLRAVHAPRGSLLAPLVCALQDKDSLTRLMAADSILRKAEQLHRLPQTVWHGYGQPAGVGLAAIRTAAGDEVESLLLKVLQDCRDWWCLSAAITLALALAGSAKTKAWEVLLDRLGFASGCAIAKGLGQLNDDLRSAVSVKLGLPHPALIDKERTEDALKHLESSWWRLREQASMVLKDAVQSGCYEAGMGVVRKLSHTSSRLRLSAIDILQHISSRCLSEVSMRATEALLERLHDPVAEVRSAANDALTNIAANGGFGEQALETLLRPVLRSSSAEARRTAAQVLLSITEVETHGPRLAMIISSRLLRALLASDVSGRDGKNVALSILAQVAAGQAAAAGLKKIAKEDEDASVRLAALDALAAVAGGSRQLKDAALYLILDEDDVVRDAAAEILEHLDLEEQEAEEEEHELQELQPQQAEEVRENIPKEPSEAEATQEAPGVVQTEEVFLHIQRDGQTHAIPVQLDASSADFLRAHGVLAWEDPPDSRSRKMGVILDAASADFLRAQGVLDWEDPPDSRSRKMGVILEGLMVTTVMPGTCAEQAGMKEGDELLKVDGVELTTQEELCEEINKGQPRKQFLIAREDSEVELFLQFNDE